MIAYNSKAIEKDGHGLMTGPLLRALQGEIDEVIGYEGQITLNSLYDFLYVEMPTEQKPSLSGDSAARDCILAWHPERAAKLPNKRFRLSISDRPRDYIPFQRNR